MTPIIMPQIGQDITIGRIIQWFKQEGEEAEVLKPIGYIGAPDEAVSGEELKPKGEARPQKAVEEAEITGADIIAIPEFLFFQIFQHPPGGDA